MHLAASNPDVADMLPHLRGQGVMDLEYESDGRWFISHLSPLYLLSHLSLLSFNINVAVYLFVIRSAYHSRSVEVWVELCDFPQRPFTGGCLQQKWWDCRTMSSKKILSAKWCLVNMLDSIRQNNDFMLDNIRQNFMPDSIRQNNDFMLDSIR